GQPEPARLVHLCGSAIEMHAVDWLWPDRFAIGKLGLIVGLPEQGKDQILCDIAARITQGAEWPLGEGHARRGRVIILTVEDSLNDTVMPRLRAAGADLDRIEVIRTAREGGKERMPSLVTDLAAAPGHPGGRRGGTGADQSDLRLSRRQEDGLVSGLRRARGARPIGGARRGISDLDHRRAALQQEGGRA